MAGLQNASAGLGRLEELAAGESPVHSLHPMAKLYATVIYIVAVISFPSQNISGLIPFVFYPAILMPLSSTPYAPLLRRCAVALPFALLGGLANVFLSRGTAFYIGTVAVSLGAVSLVSILLKTLLTVMAVLILVATTSFVELGWQLSLIKVPKILCMQLVMTYRYLSVLSGEVLSMYKSYSLRSPGQRGVKMKDMGSFLGQLLLHSFDRADRVYRAMKCRGFDGVFRGAERDGFRKPDIFFAALITVAAPALRFFNFIDFLSGLGM